VRFASWPAWKHTLSGCESFPGKKEFPVKKKDDRMAILFLILQLVLVYAFMLTDSCALRAFSSFFKREALLRWERSFMKAFAST
jgi:hypothetical protein